MTSDPDRVVLLHGLLNRPIVTGLLAWRLRQAGYEVHNWGYRSRHLMIEEHVQDLSRYVRALGPGRPIHFVGFSMGSLIVRYLLAHESIQDAGRFVMIGPPNRGSDIAEHLYPRRWFRWLYKDKAIRQLLTSNTAFFDACGIPKQEFGIIAGSFQGWPSRLFGLVKQHDGAVSVESTRLAGAKDFVILPLSHMGLVFSKKSAEQTVSFLKNGHFTFRRNP